MRSSWPIVVGVAFLGAAAAWYDAKNETRASLDGTNIEDVQIGGDTSDLARAEATQDRTVSTPRTGAPREDRVDDARR